MLLFFSKIKINYMDYFYGHSVYIRTALLQIFRQVRLIKWINLVSVILGQFRLSVKFY